MLLNNRAELLLALEHLTMEVLRMPPEDHARLCFDANDYRMLRMEELRLSAAAAADKVRRTGVPFTLQPDDQPGAAHHPPGAAGTRAGVRSESSGVGGHRQVVVYPEGMSVRRPNRPRWAPPVLSTPARPRRR